VTARAKKPGRKKPAKKAARKRPGKAARAPKPQPIEELPEAPEPVNPGHRYAVGNQFWKARSSHGRKPLFKSPGDLAEAAAEYFEWVDANPLQEERPFAYQGEITMARVNKMRAMTLGGLCIFLDIDRTTWKDYADKPDFSQVCGQVEEVIRAQKFEGAAADLLNHAIIARDLGLVDKQEHTINPYEGMTDDQLRARHAALTGGDQTRP